VNQQTAQNIEETSPANYQAVVQVFIELRSKGVSLSAQDLDILEKWESRGITPRFICDVLFEIYKERERKNIQFPKSLNPISKRVDKIISKMREV